MSKAHRLSRKRVEYYIKYNARNGGIYYFQNYL